MEASENPYVNTITWQDQNTALTRVAAWASDFNIETTIPNLAGRNAEQLRALYHN